ncbi:LytTR family DNA-binding domain-containing protein [Mesorhizobium retamae]|uniref:LytTR family transcriptional regulator n=1 Tax=Mesorhizobium retamae TaxID=2912854 RepID=A0ABS9QEW2_9HYPH|nr:LytTR family DNA-binding domain-containing protein [Mesorhizobium sp. IRAMC:0171]MCG7505972.1 LytTR family transcriptional regulator [Mesorhizobium sp. IRAMC:0171]
MTEPPPDRIESDRRIFSRVLLLASVFLAVIAFVNATTLNTDAVRTGSALDARIPWIQESSSVVVVLLLLPLVALWERRFPIARQGLPRLLAVHVIGSIIFSALHVAGMILLRKAIFASLLGQAYDFFDEPLTDLAYEYRKDVLTYATILLMLTLMRSIEFNRQRSQQGEQIEAARLTLKSGGRTILLDAQAMEWARAAANYVDVHARGTTHLVRISLTALQAQLQASGVDAVRVHRSWIVNRAKIVEIVPLGDGDVRIRTSDGSDIRGSRRYRHLLDNAAVEKQNAGANPGKVRSGFPSGIA